MALSFRPLHPLFAAEAGPVEAAVTNKALGFEVPEERRVMSGYGGLDVVLDTLEQAVAGRAYIAGERFSAADVYVGSQIGWGLLFGSFEPRPAFQEYWARLEARPARKRAEAIDEAAMPAT